MHQVVDALGRFLVKRRNFLHRSLLLAAVELCLKVQPSFASGASGKDNPPSSSTDFQARLKELATFALPGRLGVTVVDLTSGRRWEINGNQAFPMMSVFKAPSAAAILAMVDRQEVSLTQPVIIRRQDLRGGASEIARRFQGQEMTFTVLQLLRAAVSKSDNTAIDALLRSFGGPAYVTKFLQENGIKDMRVDLDEGGVEQVFSGLNAGHHPPRGETVEARLLRLEQGYRDFLSDPRNRSTPDASALFLELLWRERLLSKDSTRLLLSMMENQTMPRRLRAGLPAGIVFADKCGTSVSLNGVTAAFNDIGILTFPDGHSVIVTAFLSGSTLSRKGRDTLFAALARDVVSNVAGEK
ncbi:class A beta-lactamase [Allorhizobium sp. BGMRC 0089]|uniref:class A beta-lactamase n=1 Tax=Allorhizobium sonneratiae TaxID=2934936 RepID=UPI0020342D57|nr:class A beta-lactamase [Allorhizobium sonneratiae]MCM2290852.1 class A beta-lactamase [Allorhizobium sonneratiae]